MSPTPSPIFKGDHEGKRRMKRNIFPNFVSFVCFVVKNKRAHFNNTYAYVCNLMRHYH
jgi:hypothetical protein